MNVWLPISNPSGHKPTGDVRVANDHAPDLEERRGHVLGVQDRRDLWGVEGVRTVVERERHNPPGPRGLDRDEPALALGEDRRHVGERSRTGAVRASLAARADRLGREALDQQERHERGDAHSDDEVTRSTAVARRPAAPAGPRHACARRSVTASLTRSRRAGRTWITATNRWWSRRCSADVVRSVSTRGTGKRQRAGKSREANRGRDDDRERRQGGGRHRQSDPAHRQRAPTARIGKYRHLESSGPPWIVAASRWRRGIRIHSKSLHIQEETSPGPPKQLSGRGPHFRPHPAPPPALFRHGKAA